MVFSLAIVAFLILPSVLGKCCMPEKYSATIVRAGGKQPQALLMDFAQKKYIIRPFSKTAIDFVLTDLNDGNVYTMRESGVCTITKLPVEPSQYGQCFHRAKLVSTAFFGTEGKFVVESYQVKGKGAKSTITVTKEGCIPVASFSNFKSGRVRTSFWLNVTTTVTDLSPLNVDTSNCVRGEDIY